MAPAADTLETKSAPHAATDPAPAHAAPAARTPHPRVLRARARLRAIHRSRRFKESARNK